MNTYIVATEKPWNVKAFFNKIADDFEISRGKNWHLVTNPNRLPIETEIIQPRYIFFPHWSHKIPKEVLEDNVCIGFHETDLPFGRGGSPIQNLIARGYTDTKITAFRMREKFDTGEVLMKRDLSLLGGGEEIYIRCADIVSDMILEIAKTEPKPVPQRGKVTTFKRIVCNHLVGFTTLQEIFDHIRMVDAEGYPKKFIYHGGFDYEFSRPALRTDRIEANVTITKAVPRA